MKKQGIQHDGSPDMRYPSREANNVMDKFLEREQREKSRRISISERRKGRARTASPNSVDTVDGNKVYSMSETNDPSNYTRREAAAFLSVDPYQIKEAIRNGVLSTDGHGLVLRSSMSGMTAARLIQENLAHKRYNAESAAKILDVEISELAQFFAEEGLSSDEDGTWGGDVIAELLASRGQALDPDRTLAPMRQKPFDAKSRAHVTIPVRPQPLDYVGFHLGPTNSGKTYKALENLCEEYESNPNGRYVYSGPLRMLAYEVYSKMVARYGEDNVGFITGEEAVNPEAPIIAATAEMTPLQGDVIIIDEAHWILDPERGHYWTRLLTSSSYRRMHIIAAQEAAEGLEKLVSDARLIETEVFSRRTKINYEGSIHINKIPEKTAVVCFSRNDVYKVYDQLLEAGKKACVLYGALPVEVRKKQIHDYENGIYDIVVTTNVIGHGINLPIDNVVFAGTERFDGESMIELPLWEAGQISGRAGRFGLSEKGRVYILEGMEKMTPESTLVRGGVNVAAGRLESGLEVDRPFLAPKFSNLGLELNENAYVLETLNAWSSKVETETGFLPAPLSIARKNLKYVASHLGVSLNDKDCFAGKAPWIMSAETLWILATGPFDNRGEVILPAAEWLNSKNPETSHELRRAFTAIVHADKRMEMESLESAFKAVSEFKMLAVAFGKDGMLGTLSENSIHSMEKKLIDLIQWKLEHYTKLTNTPDERK